MATFKSITKVRVVGVLDAVITVALLGQIICCTIYPLWKHHSAEPGEAIEGYNSSLAGGGVPTTPIPRYILVQEAMNSINGHEFNSTNYYRAGRINSFWIWLFLGLVLLFGIVPVVAAGALIKATGSDIDPDKAIQLTRFWMHCNMSTFLMAAVEFIVVLLMPILGFRVSTPLPTLLYLGVRAIFTFIVLRQLNSKIENPLIANRKLSNNDDPETCSIREKSYTQD